MSSITGVGELESKNQEGLAEYSVSRRKRSSEFRRSQGLADPGFAKESTWMCEQCLAHQPHFSFLNKASNWS